MWIHLCWTKIEADMLALGYHNMQKRIHRWVNILLKVVAPQKHTVEKLLTIGAIYIKKLKQELNVRKEFRGGNSRSNISSNHSFDVGIKNKAKKIFLP